MKNRVKKYQAGGETIADVLKKYSPTSYQKVEEDEAEISARGQAAKEKFKEGKYGEAAVEGLKGLGTTAKMYAVSAPKAMKNAAINRIRHGKKDSEEVENKAKGGMIKSSASKRADGCAIKGKTKGRMI